MNQLSVSAMGGLIFTMQLVIAMFVLRALIARFPGSTLAKGLASIVL
jgi:hypothetical protein